jgi:phospholipid-binding lipoprotein MlaA
MMMRFLLSTLLWGVVGLGSAWAQATVPNPDPWESFNRKVFGFNEAIDRAAIQPVARTYRNNVPRPIQTGVSNFFGNLRDLWSGVNSALQAKPGAAIENTGRFLINTTIGIYGVFDVATHLGLERHSEDFGQTLGRWGVPTGPYVVLPLFGPSNIRDGLSFIPDSRANLINQVDDSAQFNVLWAGNLIDRRAQLLPLTDQVDRVALDKYTFTRDTYLRKRLNDVYDGNPPDDDDNPDNAEPAAGRTQP